MVRQQRAQELEAARAQKLKTEEAQARLQAEIAAIGKDAAVLNQKLIDSASSVRQVEEKIRDSEERIQIQTEKEQVKRAALESRRTEVVQVLAALQRAGRRAPPALLVRPEDALESLRTAMLLGAVVPELQGRAERLIGELGELVTLRESIAAEHSKLAEERDRIRTERNRLTALVDERQRLQMTKKEQLTRENAQAVEISRQVSDLQALIEKAEREVQSSKRAALLAERDAAEKARLAERDAAEKARRDAAAVKKNPSTSPPIFGNRPDPATFDPARTRPALAFASAKGLLRIPVNGTRLRNYGASSSGGVEKGDSLTTAAGAQVTAPCDSWVIYAGPYRSYGQVLILNAGEGYHVVIAGMEHISVNMGQFVRMGEPVATMGSASPGSILGGGGGQPVLYIEFRKDNTPIDPGPWWVANEGEKVRG